MRSCATAIWQSRLKEARIPREPGYRTLNGVIRKVIKDRGPFPSEDVAEKLIYLAIREHEKTARTSEAGLQQSISSPSCSTIAATRSAVDGNPMETGRQPIHGVQDTPEGDPPSRSGLFDSKYRAGHSAALTVLKTRSCFSSGR